MDKQQGNNAVLVSNLMSEIEGVRQHGPQHEVRVVGRKSRMHKLIMCIKKEAADMVPLFIFSPVNESDHEQHLGLERQFYDEAYSIWKNLPPLVRTMILRGFVSHDSKGRTLEGHSYSGEIIKRAIRDGLREFIDDLSRSYDESETNMGDRTGIVGFLLIMDLDEKTKEKLMHLLFEVYPEYANVVSLWRDDDLMAHAHQRTLSVDSEEMMDRLGQCYAI